MMEPLGEPVDHEEDENKGIKMKSTTNNRGNGLNYEEIASKLINENFLLTALELHTELVERGRGIKTLKEFFSNPGNFERQASLPDYSPTIPRSSSQATLDSLDLTRYSEDGERGVDERVAVLEFELRKAKETINALRANLTVATESENLAPESGSVSALHKEPIKPHEKRALNFLVNEYLMRQGYKLTSITFSDENEDQDFEDWDDVGLNIPKPPELLFLFRESSRQWSSDMKSDASCQTTDPCQEESQSDAERMGQLHDLIMEADLMREQISVLQQEKQELQALIDANGQKDGAGDVSGGEVDMEDVSAPSSVGGGASPECFEMVGREDEEEEEGIVGREEGRGKEMDVGGEVVDGRGGRGGGSGGGPGSSSLSSGAASETGGWTRVDDPLKQHPSTPTLNSMASTSSPQMPSEMTPQKVAEDVSEWLPSGSSAGRKLPSAFRHEVLSRCFVNTSRREGSLVEDILAPDDTPADGVCHDMGADARILRVAHLLARSLPRIVPNVVLTQREELIPLMICTVWLHPDPSERNRLLSLLFNLKKRPTPEERQTILAGIVAIAKCSGLSLVEGEILPQCWEQIGHRHMERRLLVAESCSALAPYVSATVRNSLMLSMLQQMLLEETEEEVRAAVVTSIALVVAFVDDKDKYFQCEELTVTALGDSSELVRACAMDVLLPVLAQWALMLDRLHSHLFHRFLHKLKSITTSCIGKTPPGSPLGMAAAPASSSPLSSGSLGLSGDWRAALTVRVLKSLLPHLLTWVVDAQPVWRKGSFAEDKFAKWGKGFTCLCHGLFDPAIFHDAKTGDMKDVRLLAGIFQELMEQECPETWPQLEWLIDEMLPGLMDILRSLNMGMECTVAEITSLFYSLCCGFGRAFTVQKVNPLFVEVLQGLEGGSIGWWAHPSLVPVYLIGVLAGAGQEENDIVQVGKILSGVLRSLPPEDSSPDGSSNGSSGALMALEASVVGLCQHPAFHETVLTTLWEGVVHPRAGVRGATASLLGTIVGRISEPLVVSRVAPALVTLASDPDVSVKAATIPAFGTIITHSSLKSCPQVQDKAHMQIQSFLVEATAHEFGHGRAYSNLLLTLVTTLRSILPFSSNAFRDEVVLPQLSVMASQVSSVWKGSVAVGRNSVWADGVAVALVETFATALDCASSRQNVASILLPGLRCLEAGGKEFLPAHHDTVLAMIREAEIHNDLQANRGMERTSSGMSLALATANMGQGVEDMRNRMTKIFQVKPSVSRPSNLPNIPGIFRKK
ncbi:RAB11-binding protein RELCH homolog [Ischnura elegans]|uniref:RAB11-binding protein RELCH homolog n=1 Tax=Ischnura elegans TaxID=197161 RepID=UPI001ED8712D|nr:RAB11-binding protein RELCH homolog [Ischnura elegans]